MQNIATTLLASTIAVLFSLGCRGDIGEDCKAAGDCRDGLVCFVAGEEGAVSPDSAAPDSQPAFNTCVTAEQLEQARAGIAARAQADAKCRDSHACRKSGACTAAQGQCIVGSDADCRASSVCRSEGWCRLVNGRCSH